MRLIRPRSRLASPARGLASPARRRLRGPSPLAWLAAVVVAVAACDGPPARQAAERSILEQERKALAEYLATPPDTSLVPFGDILVTVHQDLIQIVLDAALPHTRTVAERFRLTLDRAEVRFRSGLGLVELEGRAALAERPDVFADVTVFGLLDIVGLDPTRSTLRMRVEVLGLDTRDVGVQGISPPAERLVDALAERKTGEFNQILDRLEIPVRLQEVIELPGLEEAEVTIRGGSLPLTVALRDVKVLEDRLWVSVGVDVGVPLETAAPAAGDGAP